MGRNDVKTWRAWRDENYDNTYVTVKISKELNLFLSRGYEHLSSLAR